MLKNFREPESKGTLALGMVVDNPSKKRIISPLLTSICTHTILRVVWGLWGINYK